MLLELFFITSGAFCLDSFSVSDVKVLIDGLCASVRFEPSSTMQRVINFIYVCMYVCICMHILVVKCFLLLFFFFCTFSFFVCTLCTIT